MGGVKVVCGGLTVGFWWGMIALSVWTLRVCRAEGVAYLRGKYVGRYDVCFGKADALVLAGRFCTSRDVRLVGFVGSYGGCGSVGL